MTKKLPDKSFKQEPTFSEKISNMPDKVEDPSQMVDMAAELFAELFWRHWLYLKSKEKKGHQKTDP